MMKRIALLLSIFVIMSVACSVSGTVTPPAPDLPVNTPLPANTEVPVVNTEVPSMGSTRVSETDGMTLVFVPGGIFQWAATPAWPMKYLSIQSF